MSFNNVKNIVCLVIGSGSQNELSSFNGIAHVSEHVVLLKLLENNHFLSISGVTNFDNTKFVINSPDRLDSDFFHVFLIKCY